MKRRVIVRIAKDWRKLVVRVLIVAAVVVMLDSLVPAEWRPITPAAQALASGADPE